ncbi:MAG: hypothetical protein ACREJX_11475, partial [Polyangiaceae bacterium]
GAAIVALFVSKNTAFALALSLVAVSIGAGAFGVASASATKDRALMRKMFHDGLYFKDPADENGFREFSERSERECTVAGGFCAAPSILVGGVVAFLAWRVKKKRRPLAQFGRVTML